MHERLLNVRDPSMVLWLHLYTCMVFARMQFGLKSEILAKKTQDQIADDGMHGEIVTVPDIEINVSKAARLRFVSTGTPVARLHPDLDATQLKQLKVMLSLEVGMAHHFFYRIGSGKQYFDEAKAVSGLDVELTAQFGKRTKFQKFDISQLTLLATSSGEPQAEAPPAAPASSSSTDPPSPASTTSTPLPNDAVMTVLEEAKAAMNAPPPEAREEGTFIAASTFQGQKDGFIFKIGPHGTGYIPSFLPSFLPFLRPP
jgi:hypothetical protein